MKRVQNVLERFEGLTKFFLGLDSTPDEILPHLSNLINHLKDTKSLGGPQEWLVVLDFTIAKLWKYFLIYAKNDWVCLATGKLNDLLPFGDLTNAVNSTEPHLRLRSTGRNSTALAVNTSALP